MLRIFQLKQYKRLVSLFKLSTLIHKLFVVSFEHTRHTTATATPPAVAATPATTEMNNWEKFESQDIN